MCTGDDTDFEYLTADEAKEKGLEVKKLSGIKFRQMLRAGEDIPEWFAFKSAVDPTPLHPDGGLCAVSDEACIRRESCMRRVPLACSGGRELMPAL